MNPTGVKGPDHVIRRLDCSVMQHFFYLHQQTKSSANASCDDYATVRALFPEGKRVYPHSGFLKKTHIQLCVKDQVQILGVFRLPKRQRSELKLPDDLYNIK